MKKYSIILLLIAISRLSVAQETSKVQIDYFDLINTLNEYKTGILESFHLIRSWVFIDKKSDTPLKIKLSDFQQKGIVRLNEKINSYNNLFDSIDVRLFMNNRLNVDELIKRQKLIMHKLDNYGAYDDPAIMFEVFSTVEDGGEITKLTDNIMLEFDKLIQKKTQ